MYLGVKIDQKGKTTEYILHADCYPYIIAFGGKTDYCEATHVIIGLHLGPRIVGVMSRTVGMSTVLKLAVLSTFKIFSSKVKTVRHF